MKRLIRQALGAISMLLIVPFLGQSALADDADDLTQMLHDFLNGVSEAAVHDRFWAEDLVYTSSAGTRTDCTTAWCISCVTRQKRRMWFRTVSYWPLHG